MVESSRDKREAVKLYENGVHLLLHLIKPNPCQQMKTENLPPIPHLFDHRCVPLLCSMVLSLDNSRETSIKGCFD